MRATGRRLVVLATMLGALAAPAVASAETISGKLPDGSNYKAVMPAQWNGTLVLDLDFANDPAEVTQIERWMTAEGYAVGGISREPVGYRFDRAVDGLLAVRGQVAERWGTQPSRTLVMGVSRGAFVARVAMEAHPEVFDGALVAAGGGAGEIATMNAKLDGLWTLKTLVDPAAPLALVGIENAAAENAATIALTRRATSTPEGRARLALASAFEQMPGWTLPGQPEPARDDWAAQIANIGAEMGAPFGPVFAFANPAQVRQGVERVAGGNVSWNHGVDYGALLARSGRADFVRALYRAAGLDLQADLRTLDRAPRISADPAAVARAERVMAYTGEIAGPVMMLDDFDQVDATAYEAAYEQTVRRAGNERLLRTAWVRRAGHANLTDLELLTGLSALVQRLDAGRWPATSSGAMDALAARLDEESELDLGTSSFFEHHPLRPLRTWDGDDFGTYRP